MIAVGGAVWASRVRLMAALVLLFAFCTRAWAHPAVSAVAIVKIEPGGALRITLIHDALAFALNDTSARIGDPEMLALLDGPETELAAAFEDGRERMQSGFRLKADGVPLSREVILSPNLEAARAWKLEHPERQLPCKLDFVIQAEISRGAKTLTLRFPEVLADVILSVDRPGLEAFTLPLAPGETSPEIDVQSAFIEVSSPAGREEHRPGFFEIGARYIALGYWHIIPRGIDHALFVLGLFLLSPRIKSVVWQITAFTLAHSITLSLAALHILTISSRVVEPTIAFTIAFIGIENLVAKRVQPWRVAVAFIFGLVHGLGFASGLMEIGLPTGQLATGIIAFNIGVEGGHLTILLIAFCALGWCRDRTWYRARVSRPISALIALTALVWFVQRIMLTG